MAVTFDAVGPAGGAGQTGAGVSSLTWTHVVGGSATEILIGFSTSDSAPTVTSVKVGTTSCTLVAKADVNGSGSDGEVYKYRLASPPTGSQTIAVTMSGASDMEGGSVSYTGSGSLGTPVTANNPTGTSTGSVQVTVATTSASSIVDMNGAGGSAFNASASTGTARWVGNLNGGSAAGNGCGVTAPGTAGNVTPAIGFQGAGSDFWGAVGVEVLPAAAAGGDGGTAAWEEPWPPALAGAFGPARPFAQPQAFQLDASPALQVSAGVAAVAASAPQAAASRYITGIAGTGASSYFTDNTGAPRLVWGDAAWALCGNAGRWNSGNWQGDFDAFLANRAAQGFTVVYTKPMGTTQSGNIDDNGGTFDSLFPFQGGAGANPSTGLTSAFWARIDYFLASAQAKGITAFLNAIGYASDFEGGPGPLAGKSSTEFQAYGAAIGARYASQPNLVWMVADDYFGGDDTLISAFLTGLRGAGDSHLIAIENMPESTSRNTLDGSPSACAWGTANAQFNFTYSYNEEYYGVEQAYAESSPICVIQGDGYFYAGNSSYSGGSGAFAFDRAFRQAAWWSLASAARGKVHGSESIWQYDSSALSRSASDWWYANNALPIRTLVESLPGWHLLLPDTASALVTGGRGTRASAFASGGGGGQYEIAFTSSYVAASLTVAGDLALLYLPVHATITIDQSKLAGGYVAYWADPVTGATTSTPTGSTYNSTAQGSNSQGDPDWVLILRSPPAGVSASAGAAAVSAVAASPVASLAAAPGAAAVAASATAGQASAGTRPGVASSLAASVAGTAAAAALPGVAAVTSAALTAAAAATAGGGVAVVTAAAPGATVNTSGSANAVAGVAAVSAAAAGAAAAVAGTAGAASATATALAGVTAHAVAPAAAAVTVTAPGATVSASGSVNAVAGVAAVLASAPAATAAPAAAAGVASSLAAASGPSLAIAARAPAAAVLVQAVNVPPKFTVGKLTAATYAPSGLTVTSSGVNTTTTS